MPYALRHLRRTPGFTAIGVLTLVLGIATSTAIFAIADEFDFKPIAGTNLDDVYTLVVSDRLAGRSSEIQFADFEAVKAVRPNNVVAVAGAGLGGDLYMRVIQIPGRAKRGEGMAISGGYADVYRLRAQVGRWISDEDNRGPSGMDVVVISDRIWRDWFDARPAVAAGGSILISGRPHQVIGVAPPGFEGNEIDFWRPLGHPPPMAPEQLLKEKRKKQPGVSVTVRLAPGASPATVGATLSSIVGSRVPTPYSPGGTIVLSKRRSDTVDRLARTGYIMTGFGLLVFFAACANFGNMVLARTIDREGELATRLSLGATHLDLVRLLFAETVLVVTVASLLGLALAAWALRLFGDISPPDLDYVSRLQAALVFDRRVLVFAFASTSVALLAGLVSVWRSNRVSLVTRLAAASHGVVARAESRTLRTLLVSVQVTAAVVSLIAAGIFLENTGRRSATRLQFDTAPLVAARVELPYGTNPARGTAVFDEILTRVRGVPGVSAAAIAHAIPGGEAPRPISGLGTLLSEPPPGGLAGLARRLDYSWIRTSPGLASTLGLAIDEGRDFQPIDAAGGSPVAIVSRSVADQFWPGQNPIGRRIQCCGHFRWRTVVGVVANPLRTTDTAEARNFGHVVLVPAAQEYEPAMLIVVRSPTPLALVEALRQVLVSVDPTIPVFDAAPVSETQFAHAAAERAVRLLAGTLAIIALAIAVLGVYGVIAYFVSRRTREFGLRVALGATRVQVIKLVVDQAIHMVLIGLVPAVLLTSLGTRLFQAELTQLKPNGLTVWIVVPLLMVAAGVVAAFVPARKASRVDPNHALKSV